jgi:hypothetical protein
MRLTKKEARLRGSKISPRKAKTSADNGKLGGRPAAPDANVSAHSIVDQAARLTERPPMKI